MRIQKYWNSPSSDQKVVTVGEAIQTLRNLVMHAKSPQLYSKALKLLMEIINGADTPEEEYNKPASLYGYSELQAENDS